MRLNRGVLFFHSVVLRGLGEFPEAFRGVYKCAYIVGNTLVAKSEESSQDYFLLFLGILSGVI